MLLLIKNKILFKYFVFPINYKLIILFKIKKIEFMQKHFNYYYQIV